MNERDHEEVRSFLGAYALNAVPQPELQRVEHHIATCGECRHELDLLRAATTELAWLPPPEDAGDLVDRISSALPRRPRRTATRVAVGIAAGSVALAGFLGTALVRERTDSGNLVRVVATADRVVRLAPQKGFDGKGSVYINHGRAAVILDKMPDAGRGRAYQLWAIRESKPRSMAVLTGRGRIERAFTWNAGADEFAITIEPVDGSPVPTSEPVLVSR